jgi:hypothetical protein
MTQKSPARLARDAAAREQRMASKAPRNTAWDELNGTYSKCINVLLSHTSLGAFAKNTDLLACLDDPQGFSSSVRAMTNDILTLKSKLGEIARLHQGRSGHATPDELFHTIEINQEYMKWVLLHDGTVLPLAQDLVTQIMVAEIKLNQTGKFLTSDGVNGVVARTAEEIEQMKLVHGSAAPQQPQSAADATAQAQSLAPTQDLAAKMNPADVIDVTVH